MLETAPIQPNTDSALSINKPILESLVANLPNEASNGISLLSMLFGDKPKDYNISIVCINPKTDKLNCRFFTDISKAEQFAQEQKKHSNVYFGCSTILSGTANRLQPQNKRGERQDCYGTFGVWIEVDFGKENHSKKNIPATLQEALDLVSEMPLQPTVINLSGNGIHCHWKFDKFYTVTDETTLDFIDSLVYSWWLKADEIAKERNFTIDNVSDLPRILRVNNTLNHKSEPPKSVEILQYNPENIFTIEQVQNSIGELTTRPKSNSKLQLKSQGSLDIQNYSKEFDFVLNPFATRDEQLFTELCHIEPMAAMSFNCNRPDWSDNSSSVHDNYLMKLCISSGWNDQQIVDLCVHSRRDFGTNKNKTNRRDYYERTLRSARKAQTNDYEFENVIPEELNTEMNEIKPQKDSEKEQKARLKALKELEKMFEFKKYGKSQLTNILQHSVTHSVYELCFADEKQNIELGNAVDIHQQNKVRARLFEAKVPMRRFETKEWDKILRLICYLAEVRDTGSSLEDLIDYLRRYMRLEGFQVSYHPQFLTLMVLYNDDTDNEEVHNFSDEHKSKLSNFKDGFVEEKDATIWLIFGKFLEWLKMNIEMV